MLHKALAAGGPDALSTMPQHHSFYALSYLSSFPLSSQLNILWHIAEVPCLFGTLG